MSTPGGEVWLLSASAADRARAGWVVFLRRLCPEWEVLPGAVRVNWLYHVSTPFITELSEVGPACESY